MKYILFYIIICLYLVGCDIPGSLKINNKTSSEIRFNIELKDDLDGVFIHPDTVYIKPHKFKYLMYGFDTRWTKYFINEYNKNYIDTIHMKVGNDEYNCYSIDCKKSIFNLTNRKSKRKMELTIDSNLIQCLLGQE